MVAISDAITRMRMAKIFKDNTDVINSLDFSHDGKYLVTASDDESIHLYNCEEGSMQNTLFSKKYGVDLIRFTHDNRSVITASKNKWDDSLRYLNLHTNQYLRYFRGHRAKVVSLSLHPTNDTFASAALDDTVRLWDLSSNTCQGLIRVKGRPCVSYDPQGVVLAVASAVNVVKLYDLRSFDKGPFETFLVDANTVMDFTSLKFSIDGKYILLSTNENLSILLDAFDGHKIAEYSITTGETSALEASFSPDCNYVLAGAEDGHIYVWSALKGGQFITKWADQHSGPVTTVQWNPKYTMAASACTNLAIWLPQQPQPPQPQQ